MFDANFPISGTLLYAGNLEDITSLGVQGAPILAFSTAGEDGQYAVTHLHFGAHEAEPWPPNMEDCLAMGCSPTDPNFTNMPKQLFGCYCAPDVRRRDTQLWNSPKSHADLLHRKYGTELASTIGNILKMPANDGILLSTGNLEDVTMEGSSMTGLSISQDLHIHGWLQFGSGGHAGSCNWTECTHSGLRGGASCGRMALSAVVYVHGR